MWIEPLQQWEDGDALPIHKYLLLMILHITYGSNTKYWKRANVVGWLTSYLSRSTYWTESVPQHLQILGLHCQKIMDFFIEWHNNLVSENIPRNVDLNFDLLQRASMEVQTKNQFYEHMQQLLHRSPKDTPGEIANKRAQIKRASLRPTIDKGKNWFLSRFRGARAWSCAQAKASTIGLCE
mmetsp:Transcript_15795/g.20779  ORF Transcript_15795/g.20779 Transcript_15795/m.20779 type:complete len:181 (-) Transcript_15795:91-633(-)